MLYLGNMSKLSREEVLKLAKLSRLSLTEEEVEKFRQEIGDILGYAEQLHAVQLDGVEPTYQVSGLTNQFRQDVVKDYQAQPSDLLKNAPSTEDNQFKVKRMVG